MGDMDGGEETPLSVVRLYGMGLLSTRALCMNGSLYLTISFLLRSE